MAKAKELNALKKGTSTFSLVGKAKITDYTFGINVESKKENSDWVYSKLNLGVDCGSKHGVIYADTQSGYGNDRDNVVWVHGKKKGDNGNDMDDYKNIFTIAWEDRNDEDILENLGDKCFVTVGLEKDDKGKIVYKRFVTPYDAIEYVQDVLEDGMVVKVKGDMKWKEYNGKIQVNKEITYIGLSDAKEEEFKAEFVQTILADKDTIGKLDKESMTIPIGGFVLDHVNDYKGQAITKKVNGKVKKGTTLPLYKEFDIVVNKDDKEQVTKFLKLFKAKPKKVTQITVEGEFTRGDVETTEVSEKDIPDDIKELIELGYVDKDKVLGQLAFANGNNNKPEKMIIKSPRIKVKKGEIPTLDRVADLYDEDDINIDLILESFDTQMDIEEETEVDAESAVDAALDSDDDEDDWLADL